MIFLADLIHRIIQIFIFFIIVEVILSYFMDPYHPVRQFLNRLISPLLEPLRRRIPPVGGLDFSPLILIIGLQILDMVIRNLLYTF